MYEVCLKSHIGCLWSPVMSLGGGFHGGSLNALGADQRMLDICDASCKEEPLLHCCRKPSKSCRLAGAQRRRRMLQRRSFWRLQQESRVHWEMSCRAWLLQQLAESSQAWSACCGGQISRLLQLLHLSAQVWGDRILWPVAAWHSHKGC